MSKDDSGVVPRWGTESEIAFVRKIDEHAKTMVPRLELLRRYKAAMQKRRVWGAIDSGRVLRVVNLLIDGERAKKVLTYA